MSEPPPTPQQYATVTLELSSAKELVSAQQRMHELVISRVYTRPNNVDGDGESSQRADTPTCCTSLSFPIAIHSLPMQLVDIMNSMKQSNNRLIVRQWKRGACWWNCNTNNKQLISIINRGTADTSTSTKKISEINATTIQMAHAEVEGYRLANSALHESDVYIAKVLYFSHDERYQSPLNISTVNSDDQVAHSTPTDGFVEPWAILSYFDHGLCGGNKTGFSSDKFQWNDGLNFDLRQQTTALDTDDRISLYAICSHYPTTMVKIRHEFGFDEPHPRHGRVRIDECLAYAKMVLRDVVFPLQRYFFLGLQTGAHSFDGVRLNCIACNRGKGEDKNNDAAIPAPNAFQYHDMIAMYSHALDRLSTSSKCNLNDERTRCTLSMLKKCVSLLKEEWSQHENNKLPPVLCHMDLQPQNLAFHHEDNSTKTSSEHDPNECHAAAVMDWEEACYADPRFELMLICRKVLANSQQAEIVWQLYADQVQKWQEEAAIRYNNDVDWDIGPLEPWLKLESVHSLCTLVIQILDSVGAGRSPWETKTDLLGKIDRERQRLCKMGWTFCGITLGYK